MMNIRKILAEEGLHTGGGNIQDTLRRLEEEEARLRTQTKDPQVLRNLRRPSSGNIWSNIQVLDQNIETLRNRR